MSNDQGGGSVTAGHDSSQTDSQQKNPFSDVQNWLGFLLAGFGAVLSFLGLRSTEVTTVLRNDPAQASLIALVLLLGVLTAVLIVAIDNADAKKVSWTSAAGVVVALLGIGAFVIYAIPIGTSVGLLSLVLGSILVPLGIVILLISIITPRKVMGGVGAVLLFLGVVAFVMYAIPGSAVPVPAADRLLSLVLGSILVPLGIIILLISIITPIRVVRGVGAVLLFLGVVAFVMYAIPGSAVPVPAADRLLSLVLGSILVPLGIIILLISIITPIRVVRGVGAVLLFLGVVAFVMYAIPGSAVPVPAADRLLSLVLGSILVPLGIIILLISIITHRKVMGGVGAVLLLLGVVAFVMYAIPGSAVPVPAADRLPSLVLGSILVPLGIIILLISAITPRIIKTAKAASGALAARAGHKAARADEKKARATEKEAKAEEKTAKAEENAARAEEKAARAREESASLRRKTRRKNVDLAEEDIATARNNMANAQAKAAKAREDMARARQNIQGPDRWYDSLLAPAIPLTVVFILASVVFIAISAYGGMRLETKSQQSFSSQVGAIFSMNGSLATVRIDITAAKIPQSDWVFLDVYALPAKLPAKLTLSSICQLLYKNFKKIPKSSAACTTDPCLYFSRSPYKRIAKCAVLSNGSIVPNATGDVDETVSVPFSATEYQYVDVRAEVCSINICEGSVIGQNSRLDWAIPNTSSKPG